MTKTLDELRHRWVSACDDYHRVVKVNWESWRNRDYYEIITSFKGIASAERAMHVAWNNYEDALQAHLEAMDDAARLKPCESATTPAPPPPLPR